MSLFDTSGMDMVLLSSKSIGDIAISVLVSEKHADRLTLAEHPVEDGTTVADHARRVPSEVTLKCGWSNADYAALQGAAEHEVANGTPAAHTYVDAVYSQLLALQQAREPFELVTSRRRYRNMLLTSLSVTHDANTAGALVVDASCREIVVVQTHTTVLPPSARQADPRRTAETRDQGTKNAHRGATPHRAAPSHSEDRMPVFEIPLQPFPQRFGITLGSVDYRLTLRYREGWMLDIGDAAQQPLVSGVPLVTGVDLLAPYGHLGFGGRLYVQGDAHPDDPPTFADLGMGSRLYWETD